MSLEFLLSVGCGNYIDVYMVINVSPDFEIMNYLLDSNEYEYFVPSYVVYLLIYRFTYLSIYLYFYPSVFRSRYIYASIKPYVYLSIYVFISLNIYPLIFPYISLSIYIYLYPFVSPPPTTLVCSCSSIRTNNIQRQTDRQTET